MMENIRSKYQDFGVDRCACCAVIGHCGQLEFSLNLEVDLPIKNGDARQGLSRKSLHFVRSEYRLNLRKRAWSTVEKRRGIAMRGSWHVCAALKLGCATVTTLIIYCPIQVAIVNRFLIALAIRVHRVLPITITGINSNRKISKRIINRKALLCHVYPGQAPSSSLADRLVLAWREHRQAE
jgi:hypothetical protein